MLSWRYYSIYFVFFQYRIKNRGLEPNSRPMGESWVSSKPRRCAKNITPTDWLVVSGGDCPSGDSNLILARWARVGFRRNLWGVRKNITPTDWLVVGGGDCPSGDSNLILARWARVGFHQNLGGAHKTKPVSVTRALFYGAPPGTRTPDPLIKSQLLYQLS